MYLSLNSTINFNFNTNIIPIIAKSQTVFGQIMVLFVNSHNLKVIKKVVVPLNMHKELPIISPSSDKFHFKNKIVEKF